MDDNEYSAFDVAVNGDEGEGVLTDYKDYASEYVAKKKRRNIILIVLGALALVALVFAIFSILNSSSRRETVAEETIVNIPQSMEIQSGAEFDESEPLKLLYPNAPAAHNREIVVSVADNSFVTSEGDVFTFSNATKINAATEECRVIQSTDFCLAGSIVDGKNTYQVFFLKDAVTSKFFKNPSEFTAVEVDGSPAAAFISINLDGTGTKPVLIATTSTSSGVMITGDNLESLATQLSVQ